MLRLLNPWTIGIAVAALLAAFIGGWQTRDAFCDAARLAKENADLRARIEVLQRDAELKAQLEIELEEAQRKIDDLQNQYLAEVAADDCIATDRDADFLARIMRGGDH